MRRIVIVAGDRFGRLIAVREISPTTQGKRQWRFNCNCGNKRYTARIDHVRGGFIVSCGCHRLVAAPAGARAANTTHGMTRTPEFKVWDSMWQRCTNPNNKSFHRYGGRGIRVCKRWHKFTAFYADMGKRSPGLTIERINNDGNYTPRNCKWATQKEQAKNRLDAWITRRAMS